MAISNSQVTELGKRLREGPISECVNEEAIRNVLSH